MTTELIEIFPMAATLAEYWVVLAPHQPRLRSLPDYFLPGNYPIILIGN